MQDMKRYIVAAIALFSLLTAVSCRHSDDRQVALPDATGAPYELIAVVPQDVWEGAVGDTLTAVFAEPVKYINQYEPVFDLMRIQPSSFKDFLRKHRNVITATVNSELTEPVSAAAFDRYSKPQLVVSVSAPDKESLAQYIADNREELIYLYETAERDRALKAGKKFAEKGLMKMVNDMFGMTINIPRGYALKGRLNSGDMIVFSYEYPLSSQGVAIYSYPYTGKECFGKENIVAMRNKFMANIPGPSEGSYMTTSEAFDPDLSYKKVGDRAWAELRGFWETANDYMGGPFVSYSTLDASTGRVVVLDCYVFSPRDTKRNLLRGLEHLVYSVKFPADEDAAGNGE